MSRIAMDPEVMAVHADMHEEAVELIETKLSGIPTAVDGGLASDTVAAIMQRVGRASTPCTGSTAPWERSSAPSPTTRRRTSRT